LIADELVFLPGKEPALPMLDDRQGAKAIVLDLIDPIPIIERLRPFNQGHGLRDDHETL
jgi:hypothetical protein